MSLGTDVATQIFAQPRAFAFVSIILGFFAMIPGLPTIPFLTMAVGSGILTAVLLRTKESKEEVKTVKMKNEKPRTNNHADKDFLKLYSIGKEQF